MARILGASLITAVLLAACARLPAGSAAPSSGASLASPPPPSTTAAPSSSPAAPLHTPTPPGGLLLVIHETEMERTAALLDVTTGNRVDLGRANEASWSHDGATVHVVRQGADCVPSLLALRTDGSLASRVAKGLRSEDYMFAWSPDGQAVAFLRFHNGAPYRMCGSQGGSYAPEDMVTDLVVMAADGSHQRVLVPGGWPARFAWSPDGTGIAVVEWTPPSYDARLSVVDVSSGVVHRLADAQNVGLVDQPAWSPDGTEILLTIPDPAGDSYRIVAVDPVADSVQDLFTVAGGTHELAWSPDGGLAAAAVDLHIGDAIVGGDLGIWDAGTGANTVIQLGDVQSFATPPAWSPDGSWIAFSRVEGKSGGFGGIDIVGVDGLGRAPVPGSAGYELVSWQPAPGS